MNLHDYIIDHSTVNWPKLLSEWRTLLPSEFTVWIMNRFGDLILVFEEGSIHFLDIGCGTIAKIAESRVHFYELIENQNNANQWLMIPLIDKLVEANLLLSEGKCYGYKTPPVLGGDYTVENSSVISIEEHFRFHAIIHDQIKDVPDGVSVVLKVKN